MTNQNTRTVRVALFREKAGTFNGWVAQCLDFNLCAQGATQSEVKESFSRVLNTYFFLQASGKCGSRLKSQQGKQASKAVSVEQPRMKVAFSRLGTSQLVEI